MKLSNLYIKPLSLPITQAGVNCGTWDPNSSITEGINFGDASKLVLPIITETERLNSILVNGEIVFDSTLKKLFYGDGVTPGGLQVGSGSGNGDAISLLVAASQQ